MSGQIDYLAFTMAVGVESVDEVVARVRRMLGDVGVQLDRGGLGYVCSALVLGSGRLYWNPGDSRMGVHCQLGSEALFRLSMGGVAFLDVVLARGGHITRLDLCSDTDAVGMDTVLAAKRGGQIVTRLRCWKLIESGKGDGRSAYTLYLGNRQSDALVRFYDKAAESKIEGVLTRVELELHRERAQAAALAVLSGVSLEELILGVVDIRDGGGVNVTRRARSVWWQDWLGAMRGRICSLPRQASAELSRLLAWVERQVAPSLALLHCAFGPGVLAAIVWRGESRVPPWRWQLVT